MQHCKVGIESKQGGLIVLVVKDDETREKEGRAKECVQEGWKEISLSRARCEVSHHIPISSAARFGAEFHSLRVIEGEDSERTDASSTSISLLVQLHDSPGI